MNLSMFEDNLDRHGGNLATWPVDARTAAAHLMTTSTEARNALRAMAEVERFLLASRPAIASPDRLAEVASRRIQARPVPRTAHRAAWAAAAMVMLVLGLFVGDIRPTSEDSVDMLVATSLDPMGVTDVD